MVFSPFKPLVQIAEELEKLYRYDVTFPNRICTYCLNRESEFFAWSQALIFLVMLIVELHIVHM